MSKALEAHDKLLRQILKQHFGYEVSTGKHSLLKVCSRLALDTSCVARWQAATEGDSFVLTFHGGSTLSYIDLLPN